MSNRRADAERLAGRTRFDLGTHRRTKLRLAGCADSGTLLHVEVAKAHGVMLTERYKKYWVMKGKAGEQQARLRFVTILHEVVELDVDAVMASVESMTEKIERWLAPHKVWMCGAIEVEVANIGFMSEVERTGDTEKRKLAVLMDMANRTAAMSNRSVALVHMHGLLDLGNSLLQCEEREEQLGASARQIWKKKWAVEIKQTFEGQKIGKKFSGIAKYMTKGGNELLRYKAGFGRDTDDDLDAKMWRTGMGRADRGAETVFDERGLSVGEIKTLDAIYQKVQKRKRGGLGYLVVA